MWRKIDQFISFLSPSLSHHRFTQSYPVVWGVEMQEAFEAAGVNLTVRNVSICRNGWSDIALDYLFAHVPLLRHCCIGCHGVEPHQS